MAPASPMAVSAPPSPAGENWLNGVSTEPEAAVGCSCDVPGITVIPPARSRRRSLGEWYRMQADVDQDECLLPPDAEADTDQNESLLPPDAEVIHLGTPRGQREPKSLDYWSEECTIDLLEPLPLQQSDETEMNAQFSGERPSELAMTEYSEASNQLLIREDSTEVDSSPSVAHEPSERSAGSECSARDELTTSDQLRHELVNSREDSTKSDLDELETEEVASADPTFEQEQPVAESVQQPGLQHDSSDSVAGPPESEAQEDESLRGRFRAVVLEFIEDIPFLW